MARKTVGDEERNGDLRVEGTVAVSTVKTTNIQHPDADSPAIVLDADGSATVTGAGGGGGATGGGTDQVFYENDVAVTTDYTISTGKNAVTAGPIDIDAAATVTIPSGSTWVVV